MRARTWGVGRECVGAGWDIGTSRGTAAQIARFARSVWCATSNQPDSAGRPMLLFQGEDCAGLRAKGNGLSQRDVGSLASSCRLGGTS